MMPAATKGSKKYVQTYVNHYAGLINRRILSADSSLSKHPANVIEWVSPLAQDDYKEFRDIAFLESLGLGHFSKELSNFWPYSGPEWDALAKVSLGNDLGVLLVEAKAHLGETPTKDKSSAVANSSINKIENSLNESRDFFGVHQDKSSWMLSHYQVCNRLAHLYFMNHKLKIPTWLVWMFITDAPEWDDSASVDGWVEYLNSIYHDIGLPTNHPLADHVITVYLPPKEGEDE